MKLKRITVINHLTGWNVRDLFFDDYLTLLVGASGVGKTLILRVIKNISNIANGGSYNGLEWDITFEDSGNTYQWIANLIRQMTVPAILDVISKNIRLSANLCDVGTI